MMVMMCEKSNRRCATNGNNNVRDKVEEWDGEDDVREMVMVIGSHHGMQHNDVVQEEVAEGYTTKVCAREPEMESTRVQEWQWRTCKCEFTDNVCVRESVVRETTKDKDKQWHGRTNNDGEETGKETLDTSSTKGTGGAWPEREAHQETVEEDAVCGARPERQAHQETAEKDAVCGAKAGRKCRGRTRDGSTSSDVETCKTGIGTKVG